MSDFFQDTGHCDPGLCNSTGFSISCEDGDNGICTIGNCFNGAGMEIPNNVPIKQLLQGSSNTPWVKVWFETNCCTVECEDGTCCEPSNCYTTDQTLITTGNISQPGQSVGNQCQAAIKAFQYSWGGINAGNVCKMTIHDEQGGTFEAWFKRISRNPVGESLDSGKGVYKMKVQFGWLVNGNDTASCPTMATSDNSITLSGPFMWFLPTNITAQFQNGRFIYELEGVDLLTQSAQSPVPRVFPKPLNNLMPTQKTYFLDAVVALGKVSLPPFNVDFLQLPEDVDSSTPDNVQPLQFHRQRNEAIALGSEYGIQYAQNMGTSTNPDWQACVGGTPPQFLEYGCGGNIPETLDVLTTRGPLGVWDTRGQAPLVAIQRWLKDGILGNTAIVNIKGKGITMNYEPTTRDNLAGSTETPPYSNDAVQHGRLVLFSTPFPTSVVENTVYSSRMKALYVINGGLCSPVISFTPNMKWNFTAAMNAGGTTGTNTGAQYQAGLNNSRTNTAIYGTAPQSRSVISTNMQDNQGGNAGPATLEATGKHLRANYLHASIEAELKVQGDPSLFLCSPVFGFGRTVAILFINPFFLVPGSSGSCPGWNNELQETTISQVGPETYKTVCNEILSNRNWFIKGVDHQIKEGAYITTIKIMLFNAGSDYSGVAYNATQQLGFDEFGVTLDEDEPAYLGGDPNGATDLWVCQQGTWTCADKIIEGGTDVRAGQGTYCNYACSSDTFVT